MSRKSLVELLCKRDDCAIDVAEQRIQETYDEMEACGFDPETCEEIMMNNLGLEMDYILDVIF